MNYHRIAIYTVSLIAAAGIVGGCGGKTPAEQVTEQVDPVVAEAYQRCVDIFLEFAGAVDTTNIDVERRLQEQCGTLDNPSEVVLNSDLP
jgi:hypothetical protein